MGSLCALYRPAYAVKVQEKMDIPGSDKLDLPNSVLISSLISVIIFSAFAAAVWKAKGRKTNRSDHLMSYKSKTHKQET